MPKIRTPTFLALAALFAGCSSTVAHDSGASDPAQVARSATESMGQGLAKTSDEPPVPGVGYLQVPFRHVRRVGSPPTLELCLEESETQGLITNNYSCSRWAPLTSYLAEFFPGSGVELTRWEFECLATGGRFTTCDRVLTLYYRVP